MHPDRGAAEGGTGTEGVRPDANEKRKTNGAGGRGVPQRDRHSDNEEYVIPVHDGRDDPI